jgi:pimeloyl-ACP methyl ester carboxylesterase
MTTRDEPITLEVDDETVVGTLVRPARQLPGVLFVHGWGGTQEQYLARARQIAELGCICLTFDLRGHGGSAERQESVTREDNLQDVIAAYDRLARQPFVDRQAIAVIGSSYGGYLATILSSLRPVRWLGLRVPALYRDEDWALPKQQLRKYGLAAYRRQIISPDENRALGACARFEGDVLLVESEHDDIVPHPVFTNYMAACEKARSLTYRMIQGADHGLSDERAQQDYTAILLKWVSEVGIGRARTEAPGR